MYKLSLKLELKASIKSRKQSQTLYKCKVKSSILRAFQPSVQLKFTSSLKSIEESPKFRLNKSQVKSQVFEGKSTLIRKNLKSLLNG